MCSSTVMQITPVGTVLTWENSVEGKFFGSEQNQAPGEFKHLHLLCDYRESESSPGNHNPTCPKTVTCSLALRIQYFSQWMGGIVCLNFKKLI